MAFLSLSNSQVCSETNAETVGKVQTILALMEENRPFHILTNSDHAYNLWMKKGAKCALLA